MVVRLAIIERAGHVDHRVGHRRGLHDPRPGQPDEVLSVERHVQVPRIVPVPVQVAQTPVDVFHLVGGEAENIGCREQSRAQQGALLAFRLRRRRQRGQQLQAPVGVGDGLAIGGSLGRFPRRLQPVADRSLILAGFGEMMSQQIRPGHRPAGKPCLKGVGDARVKFPPLAAQQAAVSRVLDQSMTEGVRRDRRGTAAMHDIGEHELLQGAVQRRPAVSGHRGEQVARKLRPIAAATWATSLTDESRSRRPISELCKLDGIASEVRAGGKGTPTSIRSSTPDLTVERVSPRQTAAPRRFVRRCGRATPAAAWCRARRVRQPARTRSGSTDAGTGC